MASTDLADYDVASLFTTLQDCLLRTARALSPVLSAMTPNQLSPVPVSALEMRSKGAGTDRQAMGRV